MLVYQLAFLSALHVDSKGSGAPETVQEFVHSDTLSAALCLAWRDVYGAEGGQLFMKPPFLISSAFPYIRDVLFFPVPIFDPWLDVDVALRKIVKKVKWISQSLFEDVLHGKRLDINTVVVLPCGLAMTEAEFQRCGIGPMYRAWRVGERQRVHVDRLGQQAQGGLFFFALQFFAMDAGLYFFAEMEPDVRTKFQSVLEYLGDTGLGADRSSGLGHFRPRDVLNVTLQLPKTTDRYLSLSLFNPHRDENINALFQGGAYNLLNRSGWVHRSTAGRPPIRVLGEGSLFSARPLGRIVEMLPQALRQRFQLHVEHSAPRDYRCLSLPCVKPEALEGA
jgi:CRISPR-associated protein Csm4